MSNTTDLLFALFAAVLGIPLIFAVLKELIILQVLLGMLMLCLAFLAL